MSLCAHIKMYPWVNDVLSMTVKAMYGKIMVQRCFINYCLKWKLFSSSLRMTIVDKEFTHTHIPTQNILPVQTHRPHGNEQTNALNVRTMSVLTIATKLRPCGLPHPYNLCLGLPHYTMYALVHDVMLVIRSTVHSVDMQLPVQSYLSGCVRPLIKETIQK